MALERRTPHRCLWVACAALTGCAFQEGGRGSGSGTGSGDGGNNGNAVCFGSEGQEGYYVCVPSAPTSATTLNGPIDTDDGQCMGGMFANLGAPDGTTENVCLFDGAGVTVQNVVATGANPLVIASTADVTIAMLLDVSTQSGGQHGAGYNPPDCNVTNTITGTSDQAGGGGGAGGSFTTLGGFGGHGGGGSGGMPIAVQLLKHLRGGCPGGNGGTGDASGGAANGNGGTAGWGGGAVYVVARGKIIINGAINASGERGYGGSGGSSGGGGGGAGAGGMILLDAATQLMIMPTAVLIANGGGGGGGGDAGSTAGMMGANPNAAMPQLAAAGGPQGGQAGGNGGSGGAAGGFGLQGDDNKDDNGGGGGGGGGEGAIAVVGSDALPASSNISPDAQRSN